MENRAIPVSGELYRHFKNKLYQIVTVATHSETGERLVIYQALYGDYSVYARPLTMFLGMVDHEKYPEVTQKYRFERVERTLINEAGDSEWKENMQADLPAEGRAAQDAGKPVLLMFLDAETYAEKLNILREKRKDIDDKMADDMAASLDVVLREAALAEKIQDLENCLKTYVKFECSRLR